MKTYRPWALIIAAAFSLSALPLNGEKKSAAPDVAKYVDGMEETEDGASLHRDLNCLGFRANKEGKPYVLLRIKDFTAYKKLMDAGELAFVIWFNEQKQVANSVTYYNPHSKRMMVLVGSTEKQIELPKPPFPTSFFLEQGFQPLVQNMYLIHVPEKHPGTQYGPCQ
ncbi:MAG: hypothetical protein JNJ69_07390 [Leptospiraceae bacterium]|nr:hypothetical protein [Leptospiraceae bacterium]